MGPKYSINSMASLELCPFCQKKLKRRSDLQDMNSQREKDRGMFFSNYHMIKVSHATSLRIAEFPVGLVEYYFLSKSRFVFFGLSS